MSNAKPISYKIIRIYLLGAICLLIFYAMVFTTIIRFAENKNSANRLELIAPFHFQNYEAGLEGPLKIDPLVNIFDHYEQLPPLIRQRITPEWTGAERLEFDQLLEVNVLAQQVQTPSGPKIVYAIEDIDHFELAFLDYTLILGALILSGLLLFLIAAGLIAKTAQRIAAPFVYLAEQLEQDPGTNFSELTVPGVASKELSQTLLAINNYRSKISTSIAREKAFTRYVSHELRTPMTVIKGVLSILRRQADPEETKQYQRIHQAVTDMESLTHTFLLLARNDDGGNETINIDEVFTARFEKELAGLIKANGVDFSVQVEASPRVLTHPVLLDALLKNLLTNAIKCTIDGKVELLITENQIRVADTGVGLNEKPRGYQGFGIGLHLVQDICEKYGWQFGLSSREGGGCMASVELLNAGD